jgi:hypothetical protein
VLWLIAANVVQMVVHLVVGSVPEEATGALVFHVALQTAAWWSVKRGGNWGLTLMGILWGISLALGLLDLASGNADELADWVWGLVGLLLAVTGLAAVVGARDRHGRDSAAASEPSHP